MIIATCMKAVTHLAGSCPGEMGGRCEGTNFIRQSPERALANVPAAPHSANSIRRLLRCPCRAARTSLRAVCAKEAVPAVPQQPGGLAVRRTRRLKTVLAQVPRPAGLAGRSTWHSSRRNSVWSASVFSVHLRLRLPAAFCLLQQPPRQRHRPAAWRNATHRRRRNASRRSVCRSKAVPRAKHRSQERLIRARRLIGTGCASSGERHLPRYTPSRRDSRSQLVHTYCTAFL